MPNKIVKAIFGVAGIVLVSRLQLPMSVLLTIIITRTKIENKTELVLTMFKMCLAGLVCLLGVNYLNDFLPEYFNRFERINIIFKMLLSGFGLLILYLLLSYLAGLKKLYRNLINR